MSNDNRVEAACVPCSKDHLITVSALLNEAARMAKNRSIDDPEIQNRINAVEEELDVWERFDVSPKQLSGLTDAERTIVRDTINRARSEIRHKLEASGLRWGSGNVSDLEDVARSASNISTSFRNDITPFYVERIKGTLKSRTGADFAPIEEPRPRPLPIMPSSEPSPGDNNMFLWVLGLAGVALLGYLLITKKEAA